MRLLRLFAVAALALACMAAPAMAHTQRLNATTHRHHHRHHPHRQNRTENVTEGGFGTPPLVRAAERDLGDTAYALGVRPTLWCMAAVNHWLRRVGLPGTGSDAAFSALDLGPHAHRPVVGSLAVMRRKGGGHIGVVAGVTRHGDPVVISGNHNNRVAKSVYPRSRIIAYVIPRH